MTIKEVEQLLSVSRANIRFYEKEGLLTTTRKTNNYRDYSEENVQELKKIILFRKLGFTIDEIKQLQGGQIHLTDAAAENIARLEKEIENLEGALKLTKRIADEQTDFDAVDENYYLGVLQSEEKDGAAFKDILKDYLMFELDQFDQMWKRVFVHDFKESRRKHGLPIAVAILLLICVVRGLAVKFIWQGTFWDGFLHPLALSLLVFVITTIFYILAKKAPKVGAVVAEILLVLSVLFLGGIALLIIVLLLNSFFHFWF